MCTKPISTSIKKSPERGCAINYTVYALDIDSKEVEIEVVGIETISRLGGQRQRKALDNTFEETSMKSKSNEFRREANDVDILIWI